MISASVRFDVLQRDKYTCQLCGATAPNTTLHVDHLHPKAEGGSDNKSNLRTLCVTCNLGKGARIFGTTTGRAAPELYDSFISGIFKILDEWRPFVTTTMLYEHLTEDVFEGNKDRFAKELNRYVGHAFGGRFLFRDRTRLGTTWWAVPIDVDGRTKYVNALRGYTLWDVSPEVLGRMREAKIMSHSLTVNFLVERLDISQ